MGFNVILFYTYRINNETGRGRVDIQREPRSVEELREIERNLEIKFGLSNVVATNWIRLNKRG